MFLNTIAGQSLLCSSSVMYRGTDSEELFHKAVVEGNISCLINAVTVAEWIEFNSPLLGNYFRIQETATHSATDLLCY